MDLAEKLARQKTRNATWLAVVISGAYLVHNFYYFPSRSGRLLVRPYGHVMEILAILMLCSLGLWAVHSGKKSGYFWLLFGGALLYYLSPLAFMITLPVPITWVIARLVFKHYPRTNVWVFIIPLFVCLGAWIGEQYITERIHQFASRSKKEIKIASRMLQATVTAPGGARLRSGPSMKSAVLGTIANGEVVTILGQESGWYKVQHQKAGQNRIGYLYHTLAEVKGSLPFSESPFISEQRSKFSATDDDQSKVAEGFLEAVDRPDENVEPDRPGGKKSPSSDRNLQSLETILGRWEGTLGEQLLLIAIESLEGNLCNGYCEIRWKGSSSALKMDISGRFNPETFEILLVQKQKGNVVGTFEGTISSNARSMNGIWKFEEDPSQKYNWSVQKNSN